MKRTLWVGGIIVIALASVDGCVHRAQSGLRIGETKSPPRDLDSLATEKWIDAQRAACPGRLILGFDHMPQIDFDGGPARYHSPLVEVRCAARQ